MTNTINNVPRTMKKCAACRTEKPVSEMKTCMHNQMHNYVCDSKCMHDFYNPPKTKVAPSPAGVDDEYVPEVLAQAIMQSEEVDAVSLAAKSLKAAGVDGLDVVGYLTPHALETDMQQPDDEPLCRLSDAQAIIDGLRGEVAKINSDRLACWAEFKVMTRACLDAEKERDQQAQRIGELEGLLQMVRANGWYHPLEEHEIASIDAALSAGKEGE